MKNILILSDFSTHSKNAISYAMQLFRGRKMNFYFLNIVKVWDYTTDDLMTASGSEVIHSAILKSSKSRLEKEITKLNKRYTEEDYTFTGLTDYDVFTDAVNQAIEKHEVECIFMGADGTSNFVERILGSPRVFRKVNCPILLIPDKYQYKPSKQVLIVLGEGKQYTSSICDMAFKLFFTEPLQASVLRLAEKEPVNTNEEIALVEKDFKQVEVPYFKITDNTEDKGMQLHIVDQAIKADINIVSVSSQSLMTRLFKQSPIASIVNTVEKPTLFMES